jgi:CubicO group peptidase (beta-lactamase class C family)
MGSEVTELTPSKRATIDSFISKMMGRHKIPGLSISIVDKDRILLKKGYGVRNIEQHLPATPDTLYGVGSVTKSFTALSVMILVGRGKLRLDDKITEYLPELKVDSFNEQVSISDLITHSSGMPALNIAEIHLLRGIGFDSTFIPAETYEDFLQLYLDAKNERAGKPGKRFLYSNEGYTLIGKIIEKIDNTKYEEFVTKNILLPLKMRRSTFYSKIAVSDQNHCQCYFQKDKSKPIPVEYPDHELVYAPGGLISSVVELSNYLRMWLNKGIFEGHRIISTELVHQSLSGGIERDRGKEGSVSFYNTGWAVNQNFFGRTLISHSGSTDVSSSNLSFLPEEGIGVAIGSNTGETPTLDIAEYVLTFLIGRDPAKELNSYLTSELTADLEGNYSDYRNYTKVTVTARGAGYLELKFDSDEMSAIFPLFIENKKLYTILNGKKIEVPYFQTEDKRLALLFERHRFVKTA